MDLLLGLESQAPCWASLSHQIYFIEQPAVTPKLFIFFKRPVAAIATFIQQHHQQQQSFIQLQQLSFSYQQEIWRPKRANAKLGVRNMELRRS